MIKKSTVDDILFGKVATLIEQKLSEVGFKYQKSKKQFLRQHNGFDQVIKIGAGSSALYYDEAAEDIYLTFYLLPGLSYPAYEKWFAQHSGKFSTASLYEHPSVSLKARLDFEDFNPDSFYTPTASQQFKANVVRALSGPLDADKFIPLPEFLNGQLATLVADLTEHSDVQKIFDTRKYPLAHTFLLVFAGKTDLANQQLDLTYEAYINGITEKLKVSNQEAARDLESFDGFIDRAQKLAQKTFSNPFVRGAKRLANQNEHLKLSEKTTFVEALRLDLSEFQVRSYLVNKKGESIVLTDDYRLMKFALGGEVLLDVKLESQEGFGDFFNLTARDLEETDEFFINNFIITNDNQVLTLTLPAEKKKGKHLPSPHIEDLAYFARENKYLVIFSGSLLTYSREGVLEKKEPTSTKRIIAAKEWLIAADEKKGNVISDFQGQPVGEFEYAHGNRECTFSGDFQYMTCYGYSIKSQFYDLKNDKKSTLWAHTTFVKDYREVLYNDVGHNFGMEIARFSPDNKYLAGAAYHGKYVAWTLPKLDRIELIPPPETFELMARRDTIYSPDGNQERVKLPHVVELDGHVFFKNWENIPVSIFFIDNGDAFCMSIPESKLLLIWDRNFKNTGYLKTDGSVQLHGDHFISRFNKKGKEGSELIVYRKSS
ncbi:hypothetical protein SAMN04488109_0435 [Chryseolinea serpens]|uniref:Uncharacterized protein n=1 Tax=Chryseolinea serpens TaxID=947013 RepID=A0A1M5K457_9BACT|nr:hypothetical protein [Chryseolinea serpens]SHG47511.1 hypothetical protein SAMN04488109_0435 [Chryseolinea serpens]